LILFTSRWARPEGGRWKEDVKIDVLEEEVEWLVVVCLFLCGVWWSVWCGHERPCLTFFLVADARGEHSFILFFFLLLSTASRHALTRPFCPPFWVLAPQVRHGGRPALRQGCLWSCCACDVLSVRRDWWLRWCARAGKGVVG